MSVDKAFNFLYSKPKIFILVSMAFAILSFQNCGKVEMNTMQELNSIPTDPIIDPALAAYQQLLKGPVDMGNGFDGTVNSVAISGTDLYLVGAFTNCKGTPAPGIIKIDASGKIDSSFIGNVGTGSAVPLEFARIAGDGDVIVGTSSQLTGAAFNGSAPKRLFKLNPNGTKHSPWNLPLALATSGSDGITGLALMKDYIGIATWNAIQAYDLNGNKVFGAGGGVNVHGAGAIPGDNKMFVTMRPGVDFGDGGPNLKLLNLTNSLSPNFGKNDPIFTAGAGVGANPATAVVIVNSTGTFAIASATTRWGGTNYSWNNGDPLKHNGMYKIRVDGTEDPNWRANITAAAPGGATAPVAIDSTDRIYAITSGGGYPTIQFAANGISLQSFGFFRLSVNGTLEMEYGPFNAGVTDVKLLTDDKIVVVGSFTTYRGIAANRVIFLHADGTPY